MSFSPFASCQDKLAKQYNKGRFEPNPGPAGCWRLTHLLKPTIIVKWRTVPKTWTRTSSLYGGVRSERAFPWNVVPIAAFASSITNERPSKRSRSSQKRSSDLYGLMVHFSVNELSENRGSRTAFHQNRNARNSLKYDCVNGPNGQRQRRDRYCNSWNKLSAIYLLSYKRAVW